MHPSDRSEAPEILDLRERGRAREGEPQRLDRRLFVQLFGIDCPRATGTLTLANRLVQTIGEHGIGCVVYADLYRPLGLGLLVWTEDPEILAGPLRECLADPTLPDGLEVRPERGMLGRTYSTGFEPDLADSVLERPRRTLLGPDHVWAIWYPLRRRGAFARLPPSDQAEILKEHGRIGRDYAAGDYAHDVRLACHGLDANDNDFVIGLVGKDLYPLSHAVQSMRRTRQTAEFIESMGPFFVGRVLGSHADRRG
jgi:hypothetical protein